MIIPKIKVHSVLITWNICSACKCWLFYVSENMKSFMEENFNAKFINYTTLRVSSFVLGKYTQRRTADCNCRVFVYLQLELNQTNSQAHDWNNNTSYRLVRNLNLCIPRVIIRPQRNFSIPRAETITTSDQSEVHVCKNIKQFSPRVI